MGVVRDRLQRGQAQHLRLPRARPEDLHAGPRHRQEGDAGVPLQLPAHQEAGDHVDARRHVVLGHGRAGRRAVEPAHRARSPSRPKTSRTANCCPGCRCPTSAARSGTFYYFATDLSRYEEGNTEMGGILKRLVVRRAAWRRRELVGPPNPIVKAQQRRDPGEGAHAVGRRQGRAGRARPRARTSGCPSPSTGTGRSAARPSRSTARASASPKASGASGSPSSSG